MQDNFPTADDNTVSTSLLTDLRFLSPTSALLWFHTFLIWQLVPFLLSVSLQMQRAQSSSCAPLLKCFLEFVQGSGFWWVTPDPWCKTHPPGESLWLGNLAEHGASALHGGEAQFLSRITNWSWQQLCLEQIIDS